MKQIYQLYKYLILVSIILLWNCASIKAPPGGPVDEIPPIVSGAFPPNGSVNLDTREIMIQFSEYMDEKSFKNSIKVFPRLHEPLEFKFKGDEIILTLPDSMDSEKTYIIYLNRNIKDEHRIPLAKTVQLAYTTGDKISSGAIEGKVYSSEQAAVHLWKINDIVTDSLFATPPDYITDVNDDGIYTFSYLELGEYQVLAVEKSGGGLPLDTERTGYGLHWQEKLNLAENDTLSNINMRLWKKPQKLKLLRGEWSAFKWGKLIFNNNLPESLTVNLQLESDVGNNLDSLSYYLDPMDQKNLIVQSDDTLAQNLLNVEIASIKFNDELLLDSVEVAIQIPQETDTSYLQILKPTSNFQIASNSLTIKEVDIIFSKPIKISQDSLLFLKLFKNDSIPVIVNIEQRNPMQLQLIPLLQWEENEKYQLKINRDCILTEIGRGLKDSITIVNLRTTKNIGYGSVSGKISDVDQLNLVVELFSVKNPSLSHTSIVNSESQFEFKTIPEGNYSLYFFEDSDSNMKYNFGNTYPNIPSEWFCFYPDTFEVRANWETEIEPIKLPENN